MSKVMIGLIVAAGVVRHDDQEFGVGKGLEVDSKEQAERLVESGACTYADEKDAPSVDDGDLAAVVEAIGELDPDNEAHWTAAHLPEVAALKDILGRPVSAAERDAAWERYQDDQS